MADFDVDLDDVADDAQEEVEKTENDDELSEEQKEKLAEDLKELKESITSLKDTLGELKTVKEPFLKRALKSVGATTGAAIIFTLVGLGLKKLIDGDSSSGGGSSGDTDENEAKLAKTTALANVLTKLGDVIQTLTTWMTDHKDDTIVLSGVTIPMVDYFTTEVDAMSDAMDAVYAVSNTLVVKNDDDTKTYDAPTTGQMATIVTNAKTAYQELFKIVVKADEHKEEYPKMATLTVTQADLDVVNDAIGALTSLPYEN